ncbi:MAG TPA: glycosyl transferase [Sulfurospirillum sp. UBA11407]|nr:MAG TPA: glycosyl transferase [Sulfurospirillum sp. UBA11407]
MGENKKSSVAKIKKSSLVSRVQISVVIPTYNRFDFVQRAIKSVLEQSEKVDEIIVVDDGSTDKTKNLQNQENITYVYQPNSGVSSARNHGIKKAKYEWIAFLDSDDTWDKDKIKHQKSLHVKNPTLLASFCDEMWIRDEKIINPKNHQKKEEPTFLNSLRLCKIGASSFLSHKSLFEKVGLFDEDLVACEDYDLWLRILKLYPIKYLDLKLVNKYAGHENQLSFTTSFIDIFRIKALKKHLLSPYEKEIKEEILYKASILEKGALKHNNQTLQRYLKELYETLKK